MKYVENAYVVVVNNLITIILTNINLVLYLLIKIKCQTSWIMLKKQIKILFMLT
jgi:hypothetical protein